MTHCSLCGREFLTKKDFSKHLVLPAPSAYWQKVYCKKEDHVR